LISCTLLYSSQTLYRKLFDAVTKVSHLVYIFQKLTGENYIATN